MLVFTSAQIDEGTLMLKGFPVRLRSLRARHRLSRAALASKLGVSTPTLWGWEKGRCHPRPENLSALARVLGVSETYLTTGARTAPVAAPVPSEDALYDYMRLVKHEIASRAGVAPGRVEISIQY